MTIFSWLHISHFIVTSPLALPGQPWQLRTQGCVCSCLSCFVLHIRLCPEIGMHSEVSAHPMWPLGLLLLLPFTMTDLPVLTPSPFCIFKLGESRHGFGFPCHAPRTWNRTWRCLVSIFMPINSFWPADSFKWIYFYHGLCNSSLIWHLGRARGAEITLVFT